MTKLHIASDLSLPIEAVTEVLGFLGRRGSGKTYAAQKLAEEMYRANAQFVVLDPVGVWFGLRLSENGKDPGISIPVLGGLKGDVPIEATAGKVIADLTVDKGTSLVIDVSQFESDADKARFSMDFANRFFFRKKSSPSAVHLFIEECQEFIPQNPTRDEPKMLHAFTRMAKIGRNFGIGMSLISQRPQEVNKKVLNLIELLFAFQMTGPHERKTIQGWIADKGIDEDIAGELPKLERGKPHAWSPAWLQISRVVSIDKKWTLDASGTPKVGVVKKVRELAQIDIEQLGAEIKATAERAKAEDPKELRRQLAERDRQIRQLQSAKPGERIVQKSIVDQAAIGKAVNAAVAAERKRMIRLLRPAHLALANKATSLIDLSTSIGKLAQIMTEIEHAELPKISTVSDQSGNERHTTQPTASRQPKPIQERIPVERNGNGTVSGPQLRMLRALASFESLGIESMNRSHVAVFSGQSPTSSGVDKNFSTLRTAGLIDYLPGSRVGLTNDGRTIAGVVEAPASLKDLHEAWFAKVSGPQSKMLRMVIDHYPNELERDAVALATDQSPTSSGFDKNCSTLRSLGLIDYAPGKRIVATSLLFPEGLS